jgi:phthiocerol/phenolphthiocerol synthesis type-I polyketide synthase E
MADLEKRLAELTPEKRAALAKLLKSKMAAATRTEGRSDETVPASPPVNPVAANTTPVEPTLGEDLLKAVDGFSLDSSAQKARWKRFYDTVSTQLDGNVFGQFSYFLNYGYVPDGLPEFSAVSLPEQYINKNSVKLVLEVIQDCPVEGKRVLDVGCGRGGTIHVFKTFFNPSRLDGLDLSSAAIQFCRAAHKDPRISFHEGDAENLPFDDRSFDIVTNLESSHTYPNIQRFYSEVYRVLIPGGHFLYTDLLPAGQILESIAYLQNLGFELERDRDITRNVLLSCDDIAKTRVQAFDSRDDGEMLESFLATPGSPVYQEMQSGRVSYRILKLRKRI